MKTEPELRAEANEHIASCLHCQREARNGVPLPDSLCDLGLRASLHWIQARWPVAWGKARQGAFAELFALPDSDRGR